ncbi:TPA: hypothetical protein JBF54_14095 [Legionella pneumophila]|nr:hypothetical protein [Legionella pneumophila]HAT2001473.1 hypothetical protein [Legionella pneumophila]HAU0260666.1 hypothetical protein [Legionella pneumophila]HAU2413767.1 hypothetical protein [Legionella pneumophila]HEB4958972.1 hypothetical protein [Legionella pneumophila]
MNTLMKKLLAFEIKHNLRRPARVYVKSPDLKTIYGSFSLDNTSAFENWEALTLAQQAELKQFIHNIDAVNKHIKPEINDVLTEFRLRLPISIIHALNELSIICNRENVELNVYDPIILNIIQQMKISTAKLSNESKTEAFSILEKANIADYKKIDYSSQIQGIFAELLHIHNKSEKLYEKAKSLFEKDKSYSPKALESMASGESNPSKWLVSCAIDLLLDEEKDINSLLSEDDLFMLWVKPQLDQNLDNDRVVQRLSHMNLEGLIERSKRYTIYLSDIKN